MEFKVYLQPLIKWWRLIVVATLLAGVSSFWVTLGQPLNYQSRTTLLVGSALSNPNPDSAQIYLAQQLATIYAQFARSETIRKATMEALEITWMPQYNVRVIPNSQLIEITVIDIIPERAQVIAAEIANQLIRLSPANTENDSGVNRQEFIEEQLDTLQVQIVETRDEILKLQQALGSLNSAREIENTKNQIAALESKLFTLQSNYSGLLANTSEGAVNTIQIVEPASLPTTPIGPNKLLIVAITAVTGAVIAGAAAYLLEYLNTTFETVEDIKREFPFPILGEIPVLDKKESAASFTFVDQSPISGFAEAFRKLRTNLEIAALEKPVKTILVSSSAEGDGKSTIAINLAIAFSYLGKKVIIVDADFRHHRVHEALSLAGEPGLSELLAGEESLENVIQHWKGNIFAISSGKLLPNTIELISSQQFAQVIKDLKGIADLIVIDGPPFFLSETSSMAVRADGVLIVIAIGNSKDLVRKMKSQLEMIRAPLLGVVVNQVGEANYYGYYYSKYGKAPSQPTEAQTQPAGLFSLAGVMGSVSNFFARLLPKEGADQRKPAVSHGEIGQNEPMSMPQQASLNEPGLDVKTVPRIINPKSILDQVILKSSRKVVEEDLEYLQEIARRKRERSSGAQDADPGDRSEEESLAFLETLENVEATSPDGDPPTGHEGAPMGEDHGNDQASLVEGAPVELQPEADKPKRSDESALLRGSKRGRPHKTKGAN